eukprot:Tbor_TRINITY_DN4412_c0_g1::TRINITY_DN4412_c0_g1_i1::g.7916::m.7916
MNDIFARRAAQRMMFCQIQRSLPILWDATRVTKEKLDVKLVQEEMMRVNGHRTMPLLLGDAAAFDTHHNHLDQLEDTCSWAESGRAFTVRYQSPYTQRVAAMGRMKDTIATTRQVTCQSDFIEHLSRTEGLMKFDQEPTEEGD